MVYFLRECMGWLAIFDCHRFSIPRSCSCLTN